MPLSVESPLQKAIAALGTVKAAGAKTVKASSPDPKILAEMRQHAIDAKARDAFFQKLEAAAQARAPHESHEMYLPNITSLDLDAANRMKGFVEVDIEQGTEKGHTVHSSYGDKKVNSLREYLSLLNSYIAKKSGATSPSEATPPAATPAPTSTETSAPATETPLPAEPVEGADPNWTDPVGAPGQNHIYFPNIVSLTGEMAAAVYKQVSNLVQSRDISTSVIHARNGSAGTYSVETYMSWLAQRAATDIRT